MKRKAASAMGYGKGKQKQIIALDGDSITIENQGGRGNSTSTFVLNDPATDQEATSPDGGKIAVSLAVEGGTIVMRKGGDVFMKRSMRGEQMVMELSNSLTPSLGDAVHVCSGYRFSKVNTQKDRTMIMCFYFWLFSGYFRLVRTRLSLLDTVIFKSLRYAH